MKQTKKYSIQWKKFLGFVGIAVAAILLTFSLRASVVKLRQAEVYLRDLPQDLDGTRIVFVSQINLDTLRGVNAAKSVIRQTQELQPDLLIFGGGYTINDSSNIEMLCKFFRGLADYDAPGGKFAVLSETDAYSEGMEEAIAQCGGKLLRNDLARIKKGESTLYIVGLDAWANGSHDYQQLASKLSVEDCVIAIADNADAFPALGGVSCSDGSQWVDCMLAGGYGDMDRYQYGWTQENSTMLYVSRGVGTGKWPFRKDMDAEILCLTLKKSTN